VGLGFLVLVIGARQWTGIWGDYVARNKAAIVAAAKEYDVKTPENPDDIRVGVVSEILANARSRLQDGLLRDFADKNWPSIRSAADRYEVSLGEGEITLGDVTEVIKTGKDRIGAELLPPWDRVSLIWLFLCYLLHTIGELCLSPVGLAAMTRLAPARVVGLMMGVWFLASSVGNFLGGSVAGYYDRFELPTLLTAVATSAFAMAVLMFILVMPIRRMMAVAEAESPRGAGGH
jgi:MFS family permease